MQNWKAFKVIVHYLAERSEGFEVFYGFSQTAHTDDNMQNATGDCVK